MITMDPSTTTLYSRSIRKTFRNNIPELSLESAGIKIYTTSEDDIFDEQFRQHIENSYRRIEEECTKMSGDIPAGPITVENISTIVSKLKRRKAPGSERITFEHILFGGNQMLKCTVKHFNSVILHGQVPHAWKQGITVPL